ncbi:MAG: MBL fold metallo-hydrolase [Gammaproteobacteria bacterium]|nr:MBL fold metallo-hydrolase [Gammaproteobacteria bacterium]
MKLSFHGAAQGVTGSCHLLEVGDQRILIDCGLFQGGREIEEENHSSFGFDPATINFVLLTHAHLDHCGRLPLLVKQGFRGEIITTSATLELSRVIMLDSAGLNEQEAQWKNRKLLRAGHTDDLIEPLYNTQDALHTLDYFGRTSQYHQSIQIAKGIRATFIDAGHILGSASIFLELEEHGKTLSVLFSGDLGCKGHAIICDPAKPPQADVVVMETTYGDRQHKELLPSINELFNAIHDTFKKGGNVIIPTFALERAQELLYYLKQGKQQDQLPTGTRVFLDSPMAISATEIFNRHPECYDDEARAFFQGKNDPFNFPGLHFIRETSESMALNNIAGGAIIMAGSGMCTGGRIRHHLKRNIWRPECSIVFVGYAAPNTLARRIVDGAKTVRIFSEDYAVKASIYTIGGFSAHAGQNELLDWYHAIGSHRQTFLVHGEIKSMQAFSQLLDNSNVIMPDMHAVYEL